MKFEKFPGKQRLESDPAPAGAPGRIVMFADFPTDAAAAGAAEADILVAAQAAGVEIATAGFASESFAQVHLCCRTPMYFARARQSLADMRLSDATAVVVVLDGFLRTEVQSVTRYRAIKERRRILSLLAEILRIRPDAVLVGSGGAARAGLAAARLLLALRHRKIIAPDVRPASDLPDGRLARRLGLTLPEWTGADRDRLLAEHIGSVPRPLSPQAMLGAARTSCHGDDLRLLARIAAGTALKTHPTARWLRSAPPEEAVHHCPGPHRMMQAALTPAPEAGRFGLPISRYMMHLHTVLKLRREFPLNTRSQAETFLAWYRTRACERVPARWVPCPPDDRRAPPCADGQSGDRADRIGRAVAAALDGDDAAAASDPDTLAYLAGNPTGAGPSRLAILLAVLCRVPVCTRPGATVWNSDDIAAWFERTACRLLPACRGFGPVRSAPERPPNRLTINGIATGKTGLGANTLMARELAQHLRLPHSIRDVDSARTLRGQPRDTTPLRPMKRNVALHHVNADRIPQQIMTPELARRNDTFHIGFLLWELDRIPQAHRLALKMLDEIWAPSRFVAELYAARTTTPVHLVGKGLANLPVLRRVSAAPPDPDRFTALVCFDFHSSVERKNPLAAVRGFQIAFPKKNHRHCRLIVKTTPTCPDHWGDPADQMGRIRRIAAGDSRIEIVESFVPQRALWRMMQSASCILSTHRAEGFGYIPAYALALARPLITTDHGGPRDFCDRETSFPVPAPLCRAPRGHTLYAPQGARWADVAPDAVAAALRRVHDDPQAARARALCGQARMARDYSMTAYAARCRRRLEEIGAL